MSLLVFAQTIEPWLRFPVSLSEAQCGARLDEHKYPEFATSASGATADQW